MKKCLLLVALCAFSGLSGRGQAPASITATSNPDAATDSSLAISTQSADQDIVQLLGGRTKRSLGDVLLFPKVTEDQCGKDQSYCAGKEKGQYECCDKGYYCSSCTRRCVARGEEHRAC